MEWIAAALLLFGGQDTATAPARPNNQAVGIFIRRQIVVRVSPQNLQRRQTRFPNIAWVESRGPQCIRANSIVGASLIGQNSVDLILRNNKRIRARLSSTCPALDFYRGFYLRPNEDGLICADRDAIRSRVGSQCHIEQFKSLQPRMIQVVRGN